MIISDETRIKPIYTCDQSSRSEIIGEFGEKTGKFSTRDILVALQCKILTVALQECFKIKFGAFLVTNSTLNKVYMVKFDLSVICETFNQQISYRTLQNHKKNKT